MNFRSENADMNVIINCDILYSLNNVTDILLDKLSSLNLLNFTNPFIYQFDGDTELTVQSTIKKN